MPLLRARKPLTFSPMSKLKTATLTVLALIAFAGNSLLCRLALKETAIDAASFTMVRMLAATLVLSLLIGFKPSVYRSNGDSNDRAACCITSAGDLIRNAASL